jgi:hypothetical protein
MFRPTYESALADWQRAATTSDRSWSAYRKARERQALKRGTFAAEQGVIDASAKVKTAQDKLAVKTDDLRQACHREADRVLVSEARARVPYAAPFSATIALHAEMLFNAATGAR